MSNLRLQLHGVSKQFGSTLVLDAVDLTVKTGEIHGLIGQNGAGKSTLVKTLAGLYPDHGGRVTVDGHRAGLRSPRESRNEGIAVIFQEFSLVSTMTVAENLLLGREPHPVRYSAAATRQLARALLDSVAIDVGADLDAPVSGLSPAVMQRIEIAKALAQDARVLIMDEPTARLAESERTWLFATMRQLSDRGVGIMFISHFLEEVREITDWLTILRNGRVVGSAPSGGVSVAEMAELMLGQGLRDVLERESHISRASDTRPVALQAVGIRLGGRPAEIRLTLRQGEILGVAGLVGSGRTRLARVLAGADSPTGGTLRIAGEPVRLRHPRDGIRHGIAFIPEDRKHQGLCMTSPVADNLCLMALQGQLGKSGVVPRSTVTRLGRRLVEDLRVAPARIDVAAGSLSGGNQQKVLLGKALASDPKVLIIDQPTAGVDVGTKAQIHDLLHARAAAGAAIVVVSDDLDELYALSDRLCVMDRGRVLWQGSPSDLDRSELLAMMATGTADVPATRGESR